MATKYQPTPSWLQQKIDWTGKNSKHATVKNNGQNQNIVESFGKCVEIVDFLFYNSTRM